jgi:uncharacterized protein (DUF1810 family)
MIGSDPFDLERFVDAQTYGYAQALEEVRRGRKQSHWMWYVFPQATGLGTSTMALRYAIRSMDEARNYLAHPILGNRYIECVEALQDLQNANAEVVFGVVDAMKLRSSLTLFERAGAAPVVAAALDRWFDGQRDAATLAIIESIS